MSSTHKIIIRVMNSAFKIIQLANAPKYLKECLKFKENKVKYNLRSTSAYGEITFNRNFFDNLIK